MWAGAIRGSYLGNDTYEAIKDLPLDYLTTHVTELANKLCPIVDIKKVRHRVIRSCPCPLPCGLLFPRWQLTLQLTLHIELLLDTVFFVSVFGHCGLTAR